MVETDIFMTPITGSNTLNLLFHETYEITVPGTPAALMVVFNNSNGLPSNGVMPHLFTYISLED